MSRPKPHVPLTVRIVPAEGNEQAEAGCRRNNQNEKRPDAAILWGETIAKARKLLKDGAERI